MFLVPELHKLGSKGFWGLVLLSNNSNVIDPPKNNEANLNKKTGLTWIHPKSMIGDLLGNLVKKQFYP